MSTRTGSTIYNGFKPNAEINDHTGRTTFIPIYSRVCMSFPLMIVWCTPTRLCIVSVGSVAVAI